MPWCSYVIVAVRDGRAGALNSWVLSEDYSQFDVEPVMEAPVADGHRPEPDREVEQRWR